MNRNREGLALRGVSVALWLCAWVPLGLCTAAYADTACDDSPPFTIDNRTNCAASAAFTIDNRTNCAVSLAFTIDNRAEGAIPTVSEWGMTVMLLLVLIVGTVIFIRHRSGECRLE